MTEQELSRRKENLIEILESYIHGYQERVDLLKQYLVQLKSVETEREIEEIGTNVFLLIGILN